MIAAVDIIGAYESVVYLQLFWGAVMGRLVA